MTECAIPSCTRVPDEGRALCAKCRKDLWPLIEREFELATKHPYTMPAIETSWSPDPIGEPDWYVLDWPPKGEVDITVRSGLVSIVVYLAEGRTMILLDESDRHTLAAALLDVDRIRKET